MQWCVRSAEEARQLYSNWKGNVRPKTSRERGARLSSDGFNHFEALFGKWKKEGENISGLWPHSPSLTEYRASKVVAHGRMQVFVRERFDRRIGLFMRRSYQRRLKDKVTIIG